MKRKSDEKWTDVQNQYETICMKADHINSTQKQYNIVEGKYNNIVLQKSMV